MDHHLYNRFEAVCAEILSIVLAGLDADVRRDERVDHLRVVDIVARRGSEIIAVAEVKFYRSLRAPSQWLRQAADVALSHQRLVHAQRCFLMISSRLTDEQDGYLTGLGVSGIDYDRLYSIAAARGDILAELDWIFAQALEVAGESEQPRRKELATPKYDAVTPKSAAEREPHDVHRGRDLCADLRRIPRGRKGAVAFERAAQAALEYVFETELSGWTRQPKLDDGLRMDIAAKIVGAHDFWTDLIRDFATRFVLFECKNYSGKISQEQIYTTEKYLFQKALRSVAVLVCPSGVDAGALAAIKGAIREVGKLILWLTVDELCEMLHARDVGGEVHNTLSDRLDKLLLEVPR